MGADARGPELSSSKREESYLLATPVGGGPGEPGDAGAAAARLAVVLHAFGRGYRHDQARLEKLIRDFPQLDVEEEVADGLDWLGRPENRTRTNSLGFHRNSCKRAEARRLADLARSAPQKAKHPLLEGGARSAVGRALEYSLEHPPEVPSTWR